MVGYILSGEGELGVHLVQGLEPNQVPLPPVRTDPARLMSRMMRTEAMVGIAS